MEIRILPAELTDYPEIERIMMQVQNLHVGLRPDIYRRVETALPPEELREAIERETFFVAKSEGRLLGILQILYRSVRSPHQKERSVIFIEVMAVDEPYRGQGVGSAFFVFLKKLRREKGLDGIELQVNARNEQALAMYARCGFTPKSVNMELPEDQ